MKNIDNSSLPIKLSASIGIRPISELTRIDHQDTLIYNGEKVYVWADKIENPSNTPYIRAWSHLSDGYGALNSISPGTRFYPGGNAPIALYAVHGNFVPTIIENSLRPTELTHIVSTDQRTDPAYLISDLLYAHNPTQYAKERTTLAFVHMLCKLEVCLKPFGSITEDSLVDAKLMITNVMPKAKLKFEPYAGETFGDLVDIEIPLKYVPEATTEFDGAQYGEAIIPPQLISKKIFMKLILKGGTTLYYYPELPYSLESGKLYRFNMCVKHHIKFGNEDDPQITPWDTLSLDNTYFIEPETLTPLVTEWNYLSYFRSWNWMTLPPNVSLFDNYDRPTSWAWIVVPPYVTEFTNTDRPTSWAWEILPPLLNEWDSVTKQKLYQFTTLIPELREWSDSCKIAKDIDPYILTNQPDVNDWSDNQVISKNY